MVHDCCRPVLLGEAVAMYRQDGFLAQLEAGAMRMKRDIELVPPERAAPPVMIATDHHDRDSLSERGQCSYHMESGTRNDPAVLEPEIEEIAIDEETVAEVGNPLQEGNQRLLDGMGRGTEVRV